jgi:hypothetical protein
LEDYNVQFHYINGENNSFTDALSRLPFSERQNPRDSPDISTVSVQPDMVNNDPADSSHDPTFNSNAFHDDDLLDCFVHLPATENIPFVMAYQTIAQAQAGDARLPLLRLKEPNKFQ